MVRATEEVSHNTIQEQRAAPSGCERSATAFLWEVLQTRGGKEVGGRGGRRRVLVPHSCGANGRGTAPPGLGSILLAPMLAPMLARIERTCGLTDTTWSRRCASACAAKVCSAEILITFSLSKVWFFLPRLRFLGPLRALLRCIAKVPFLLAVSDAHGWVHPML